MELGPGRRQGTGRQSQGVGGGETRAVGHGVWLVTTVAETRQHAPWDPESGCFKVCTYALRPRTSSHRRQVVLTHYGRLKRDPQVRNVVETVVDIALLSWRNQRASGHWRFVSLGPQPRGQQTPAGAMSYVYCPRNSMVFPLRLSREA